MDSVSHIRRVKMITKRKPVRNASVPGRRGGNLIVSRPKGRRLSARQMEAELDRLADKCPPLDAQAVLNDLRS